ncbi:MAG: peptidase [Leptolyngbyaceae cyanobacterium SM1_1_3]|nr:peptidase [Leptolyngbyaceae cyanobacterium SM1_1_3]NJN01485.1 peptidase [Leptolyngbyaceae cyanobacterium RM1_1_2]NJO08702.1 peptidase [Leptolyngbyaceae cyanobacterium SL_1_1]
MKLLTQALKGILLIPAALFTVSLTVSRVNAQSQIYSPVSLPDNQEITDSLSSQDIPTGFGGFARDYTIELKSGDQVAIDVISNEFDTLVSLMTPDGATIGENDDGPDGTTNSLLFARITEAGLYTVRVRSYAGQGEGEFLLKLARLRPVNEVRP